MTSSRRRAPTCSRPSSYRYRQHSCWLHGVTHIWLFCLNISDGGTQWDRKNPASSRGLALIVLWKHIGIFLGGHLGLFTKTLRDFTRDKHKLAHTYREFIQCAVYTQWVKGPCTFRLQMNRSTCERLNALSEHMSSLQLPVCRFSTSLDAVWHQNAAPCTETLLLCLC